MTTGFKEKEFNDGFNLKVWKRIFQYLAPCKKYIAYLCGFTLVASIAESAFTLLNRYAINHFIGQAFNQWHFIGYILVSVIFAITQSRCFYYIFINCAHIESKYGAHLREDVYQKLMNLSFKYYDSNPLGWILARVTSDITRIAEVLAWSIFDFSWGLLTVVIGAVVMISINVKYAMMILILMPLLVYSTYWFQIRILKLYRQIRMRNSRITGSFNEGINGAKTTKTLVLEDSNLKEFQNETRNMNVDSLKAGKLQSIYRPFINLFSGTAMAFILWLGGKQVLNETLEIGTLFLFCQYAVQFFDPLRQIAQLLSEAQMAQANAERIVSLLNEEPSIVDTDEVIEKYGTVLKPKTEAFESIRGEVEFKHVSFGYIENEMVLKDFNLKVAPKQTIALVGETGGGKSTIINLLSRFYEPVEGTILIDGIDYKQRSIGWLHSQLGYVLQTPHLFSGSILDNIRYGKPDATLDEVIEVCKLLNAHEFIVKLPGAYDFEVGEAGSFLSTGQKQLLSFARALIHQPKLMILDEATSSIDTEAELLIQHAIDQVISTTTTFIVAHRLSTIVNADKILVIKKGVVQESGSHSELMKLKGYYYRLYTNQFQQELQSQLLQQS